MTTVAHKGLHLQVQCTNRAIGSSGNVHKTVQVMRIHAVLVHFVFFVLLGARVYLYRVKARAVGYRSTLIDMKKGTRVKRGVEINGNGVKRRIRKRGRREWKKKTENEGE